MTKEELKEYIQNNCIHKSGKWNAARLSERYLKAHNLYDDITSLYSDSTCIHETIYRLLNDIDIRPVCKACGKPVRYDKQHKFSVWCCPKCRNNDPEILEKNKNSVTKALRKAYAERGDEIKKKRAKTLTGDENGTCSPFGVKKWQDKCKESVKAKYGVENVMMLKEYHKDARQIMRKRSIEIWKSRNVDIEYIDDNYVKVLHACPKHGDITLTIKSLHAKLRRCPKTPDGNPDIKFLCQECYPPYMTNVENFVADILDELDIEYTFRDRQQIKPYELDFYIPEKKLAIECNGIYWHSKENRSGDYHLNKLKLCKKAGIKLISVWEDDCINYSSFIKTLLVTIINNKVDKNEWDNVSVNDIRNSSWCVYEESETETYILRYTDDYVTLFSKEDHSVIPLWYRDDTELKTYTMCMNLDIVPDDYDDDYVYEVKKLHNWDGSDHLCDHTGYIII